MTIEILLNCKMQCYPKLCYIMLNLFQATLEDRTEMRVVGRPVNLQVSTLKR